MGDAVPLGEIMGKGSCRRCCMLTLACLTFLAFINPAYQLTVSLPATTDAIVGKTHTLTCVLDTVQSVGWVYWKKWHNSSNTAGYKDVVGHWHHTSKTDTAWDSQVNQANMDMKWELDKPNVGGASFMLIFKEVECDEGGIYLCEVSARTTYSAVTQMNVGADPEMPEISVNRTSVTDLILELADGQTATLVCTGIIGFPAGNIDWFFVKKDTSDLERREGELISNVTVPGGCAYQASSQITFTMTKEMNGSKYWCYTYQVKDRNSFTINSVTTRSFVMVKLPKPKIDPGNPGESTGGASSLGTSITIFLGIFMITALHHVT